jgi:hypothetical protein
MVCANGDVMLGFGFTIMVYLYEAPKQAVTPATVAVALYSIVISAFVVLVKVCVGILLVPDVCIVSVIPAGWVVVQLKVTPAVLLFNDTAAAFSPEQTVCGAGVKVITGEGLTVIEKLLDAPGQPLIDGVTVMVAIFGAEVALLPVKEGIVPDPLAGKPIDKFELVQLYIVLGIFPVKGISTVDKPLHTS